MLYATRQVQCRLSVPTFTCQCLWGCFSSGIPAFHKEQAKCSGQDPVPPAGFGDKYWLERERLDISVAILVKVCWPALHKNYGFENGHDAVDTKRITIQISGRVESVVRSADLAKSSPPGVPKCNYKQKVLGKNVTAPETQFS